MKISVDCPSCLQSYQLKPELAGKKIRCKVCQEVLTVPQPKAKSKPRTVVDDELDGEVEEYEDEEEFEDRAPRRGRSKPKRSSRASRRTSEMVVRVMIGGAAGLALLLGAGLFFYAPLAFFGLSLFFGLGSMLVGYVWVACIAFQEDAVRGLLCVLAPGYCIRYAAFRWENVRVPAMVGLIGCLLMVVAVFAVTQFHGPTMGRQPPMLHPGR